MEEVNKQLQEQIRIVANARQKAQLASEAKNSARVEWESQHSGLLELCIITQQIETEAETKLRELTLRVYAGTGNKQPAPGVGIREVTRLDYEPKEALKWAMEHQIALSLDKKSFEGFAKATPLDFVLITQETQATIATDLSKYLLEEK